MTDTDHQETPTLDEIDDRMDSIVYLVDDLAAAHHDSRRPDPSALEDRIERNSEALEIMHGLLVKLIDIVDEDIKADREAIEELDLEDAAGGDGQAEQDQESTPEPRGFY